jgi:hypothetical protein
MSSKERACVFSISMAPIALIFSVSHLSFFKVFSLTNTRSSCYLFPIHRRKGPRRQNAFNFHRFRSFLRQPCCKFSIHHFSLHDQVELTWNSKGCSSHCDNYEYYHSHANKIYIHHHQDCNSHRPANLNSGSKHNYNNNLPRSSTRWIQQMRNFHIHVDYRTSC